MNIQIKTLGGTGIAEITACLVDSFAEYALKMPDDPDYWDKRFKIGHVDYKNSIGAFDMGDLIGFIIFGIYEKFGSKIVFNLGTGVKKRYRGQKLPSLMYKKAFEQFKDFGIDKYALEVIQSNERAIHVYQQIGHRITKELICFDGEINIDPVYNEAKLRKVTFHEYFANNPDRKDYSWDFDKFALEIGKEQYDFYQIIDNAKITSGFALHPKNKYLAQFYVNERNVENYDQLFIEISKIEKKVKINNINAKEDFIVKYLQTIGFRNHVSQYEMEMEL